MEVLQVSRGQVVKVRVYGGQVVERRVLADKGKIVVICAEDEYITAQREGREPSGAGFPREDVLDQREAGKL